MLRGSQATRRAVCGTRGSLRTMPGGGSPPSCSAFTHRVAFEEGSGLRNSVFTSHTTGQAEEIEKECPEWWTVEKVLDVIRSGGNQVSNARAY